MRASSSRSQTSSSVCQLFDASPGGTTIGTARMPAARERGLGGLEMARRHGLVGDDRGGGAGLERRDALPELGEQPAADHDVVGARAERHIDGDRFAGAQRSGHHRAASATFAAGAATPSTSRERGDDLVHDGLVRDFARHDRDVRLGIDRIALGHQVPDALRRIALEHRAVGGGAALDALHQHLEVGLEPDRDALLRGCRRGFRRS